MIHSPEKSTPDQDETMTFCDKFLKAIEAVFGNPTIHPCLGYRPVMWQYAKFVEAFDQESDSNDDADKSTLRKKP